MKTYRLFFVSPSSVGGMTEWRMKRITLGEEGRGRKAVIIPIVWDGDGLPQSFAVAKAEDGIILVGSPEPPTETAALAVIDADGGYSRGRSYSIPEVDGVEILASGWSAWGDAGRLGSAEHALARVQDGTVFRLRTKYSAYWHEYSGGEWKIYSQAEWKARSAIQKFMRGEGVEWL